MSLPWPSLAWERGIRLVAMAEVPLTIGLSLGADLEWPIFYEDIIGRLNLRIPRGEDTLTFKVERVTIEPFSLRQPDTANLGIAIGARGDVIVVDGFDVVARNPLGGDDPFGRRHVSELGMRRASRRP